MALFLIVPPLSLGLMPFLGQNFFPDIESSTIKLHVRAHPGTRIEEATRLMDQIEEEIRQVIPPSELASVVDNIGLPNSGINLTYSNSGTIGVADADILLSLDEENHGPAPEYIKKLREILPRKFPGTSFAFLPADMVSQILNFGSPAPLDVQVTGPDTAENRRVSADILAKVVRVPGIADVAFSRLFKPPALNVEFNRTLAESVGFTEHDAAADMPKHLGRQQPDDPDLLAESAKRRVLCAFGAGRRSIGWTLLKG